MNAVIGISILTLGASLVGAAEPIPFDSSRWTIEAAESRIEDYKGRTSLVLRGGLALIDDADFTDGVIEYLCAFPDARAFVGATWRAQDAANREEFYIRPHQSGNPDANQYTPVFNGLTAWQLYHGEGYGAPVDYEFDTWIPVRIVVSDREQSKNLAIGYSDRVRVYLDDRLLYGGNNGFRTRDYRYLGTIGWFDTITLPLRKGENELWLAVSESFGGWGVQAAFDDTSGLEIAD